LFSKNFGKAVLLSLAKSISMRS